jgi:hypothetical protein
VCRTHVIMLWHVPTSLASHGLLHMRVLHVFLPTRSCANHLLTCCEGIKIKSPIFKGGILEAFPSLHQAQGSKIKGSHMMPCVTKCVLIDWFSPDGSRFGMRVLYMYLLE